MSGEGSREVRYTAFLSYSHQDAAAAGRLHRRLENYRMPRRLAGSEGARGPIPDRLWPIFRDREELPAATDLSTTVREALARSGALIILCSPAAAASLWVAEEIETFRRLHPDRPILAAVLDGDPPDCFPAALRAFGRDGTWHEPLATDLRPHRDGARLGLLKLVAGITGVGLDALVQRDAARRVRRVTAITAVALAMMLVMGAMTLVALRARSEAEAQRTESEKLVEFMMTDLRGRLRDDVGRLDVLQSVNERALRHYQRQSDLSTLTAEELERRARVLHAVSEDDVTQGNLAGALAAAQAAYRTTEAQLALAPDDRERLFYHAQSEYWLGRVEELRENWAAARRRYVRYADAANRLILLAPGDPRSMMEVAYSSVNLGTIELQGSGNVLAARGFYARAAAWFARAVQAQPHDPTPPIEQANALAWLADTYFRNRQWPESLALRTAQYRVASALSISHPGNSRIIFQLASGRLGMGRTLVMMGQDAQGRALQIEARALLVGLTQRDPGNVEWLYLRGNAECGLYFAPGPHLAAGQRELGVSIGAVVGALRNRGDPRWTAFGTCSQSLD